MVRAIQVINAIRHESGSIAKQNLLRKYADTPHLKDILRFIYNPYHKTGISEHKFYGAMLTPFAPPAKDTSLADMLEYFKTHQTGSDADISRVRDFIQTYLYKMKITSAADPSYSQIIFVLKGIVTQHMTIGVTAKTLNTVYGKNFIPVIECMLGKRFNDVRSNDVQWPCIVTEKLDGIRRLLIKENGVCRFYSRSGHEDTGLIDIIQEAKYLPDNRVYDGELLASGTFKDCIAQRQATNSIGNSKGDKSGLTFNIFDMISLDDFWNGTDTEIAKDRKIMLGSLFGDESISYLAPVMYVDYILSMKLDHEFEFIKPVEILGYATNISEVEPIVESIWRRGGEGVMLNTALGKYEKKRSKALLKLKNIEEHTLQIVDVLEGTGKYEDTMGSIVVNYKGTRLGVGSGFTDAERFDVWNNQAKYLKTYVEIDCFGESVNRAGGTSLNCPIFKRFLKGGTQ